MARADLLKRLFRAFKNGDHIQFVEAAREIVSDERKKQHSVLANELTRILDNGLGGCGTDIGTFQALPRDVDRGSALLEVRQPDRLFSDMLWSSQQLSTIARVVEQFRYWEVLEAHSLRPSNRLLFCGPPGCGKTATAEAISCELGVPMLYVRFDAVVSSLLGETAANLGKVFDYASQGTWVLLFDEFDAIGRSRDDETEHGELKRVVNSFLQMLDRFSGRSVVIAATNFEQSLDPALWRRFDEIIRFDRPTKDQVEQLLAMKLRHRTSIPLAPFVDRLDGMAHADIERVCVDALKVAALRGDLRPTTLDLEVAVEQQQTRKQALEMSRTSGRPIVGG